MSKWDEQQKAIKENKEKNKLTKEIFSKYFLDLSKLVFAALVLGGFTPIFTDIYIPINWWIVCSGIISTIFLSIIGYRILK